ncbi:hypothetical protein NFJ02_32g82460 [Pycnococcus provasolii]
MEGLIRRDAVCVLGCRVQQVVVMLLVVVIGGWAPGSTALIQHYIDPTVQADAAAVFFGHLLPALSHPAAAAGPAAPRGAPHGAAGGV